MSGRFDPRTYVPSSDTLKRFHESTAFTRLIAGPYGSGKTTACAVAEPFFTGMVQKPNNQGVRTAKVGVLRDTYRNLYRTTIQDWHKWVPRDFGKFVGSDDRPASHDLRFDAPFVDGTPGMGPIELRVEFLALGGNSVEATCDGWAIMGAFIDAATTVPVEALAYLGGRTKRGGDKQFRVSRGVWAGFNKPDVDHPFYELCVEDAAKHAEMNFEFFDQPSGILPGGPPFRVNPNADNREYLDDDYYTVIAAGRPDWWVNRFCRNRWGASFAGQPIFGEVDLDALFSPVELEPERGDDLVLGLDGGGTPAAVIMGRTRSGRRVIYAEVVMIDPTDAKGRRLLHGVGPARFAEAIGDLVSSRFSGQHVSIGWGDPAAFYGADREKGEYSFMEKVQNVLKVPINPTSSNELDLRLDATRTVMNRVNAHDQVRDLTINPSCRFLRRGFGGDYKWTKADPLQPTKALGKQNTASSHVMDALGYACLGDIGRAGVIVGGGFDLHRAQAPEGMRDGWARSTGGVLMPPGSPRHPGQGGGQASYKSDWSPWD